MAIASAMGGLLTGPLKALFRPSLPAVDGTFEAALDQPAAASIVRDEYGVPHISAATEHDLFFLNGVVHGQDRLWQLHSARMLASGRLCEVAGARAIDMDRLTRQLGLRKLAQGDEEALRSGAATDPEREAGLRMLEAYAAGVNWSIAQTRQMPVEFWLTGQRRIEPWTPIDSLTVMRLYGFVMCFGFQHSLVRQALIELFGEEHASAWTQTVEDDSAIPHIVDGAAHAAFRAANLSGVFNAATDSLPREQGSNWWVLHGSKTTTGKPVLVGDPHLTIKIPNFWYEVHFKATGPADIDAYGAAPPGVPGMFIGHNSFFATSITLSYCDVEDLFLEQVRSDGKYLYKGEWLDLEVAQEEIRIKGGTTESITVRKTRHGVLLEGPTLLQYDPFKRSLQSKHAVSGQPGIEINLAYAGVPLRPHSTATIGMRRLLRARSFAEFDAALAHVSRVIALSLGYADMEGHIGFVLTGEAPIRSGPRGSEMLPLVGWTGEYDWLGFAPHAELPKAYDPPSGLLISANHKIVEEQNSKHYLGRCWKSGYRARAIQEELQKLFTQGPVSPGQMPALLMNVRSWAAAAFLEELQHIKPEEDTAAAFAMLRAWDSVESPTSVATTLYQFLHSELVLLLLRSGCRSEGVPLGDPAWQGLDETTLARIVAGEAFDSLALTKLLNELQGHLHLNVIRILRSARDPAATGRRWWLDQAGGADAAVNQALRAAVGRLKAIAGEAWQTSPKVAWGEVHKCFIGHPLTKALGLQPGSGPFDGPTVPLGGDTNTLCQSATKSLIDFTATSSNVSLRVVFDLSDLSSSATNRIVSPVGQSGQFNSPHYHDQTALWQSGEMRPVVTRQADVAAAARATMRFRGAPRSDNHSRT